LEAFLLHLDLSSMEILGQKDDEISLQSPQQTR